MYEWSITVNLWKNPNEIEKVTYLPNFEVWASNGLSAIDIAISIVDPFNVHRKGHMDIMASNVRRDIIKERIWRDGVKQVTKEAFR